MSPPAADDAPSPTTKSLAADIVASTRSMHTRINKLITSRVPLALPPRSSDAGAYISGMLHFLPVYMAFEKLWLDMFSTPPVEDAPDGTLLDAESSDGYPRVKESKDGHIEVSERIRTILVALYMPQLFRSDRLRGDIKSMTGWSDDVLDRQIHAIKGSGQLSAFTSHIKQAVRTKPHVLIAYSYNLFMALFAGGRYLRASFEKAGNEFWETVPGPIKPTMQPCEPRPGAAASVSPFSPLELTGDDGFGKHYPQAASCDEFLQFWHFDSPEDGEDFKRDYKERLLTWEDSLTADEREDILQESAIILESIGHIVGQLDDVYSDEQGDKDSDKMPRRPSLASHFMQAQFVARLRDSFLIARDRGVGNPFRSRSVDTDASEKEEQEGEEVEEGEDTQHHALTGAPKAMRFAKTLPTPHRRKGPDPVTQEHGKLRGGLPMHILDAMTARPIFAWIVGLLILYVVVRVRGVVSA
ncbi:heme oxygenase-like protein [Trichoderma gracile]